MEVQERNEYAGETNEQIINAENMHDSVTNRHGRFFGLDRKYFFGYIFNE